MTTIDAIFARAAAEAGSRPHLRFVEGGSQSYEQTWDRARRLAGALAARGIAPGDRLVAVMANGRALYEFYVAASLVGAIAVPVNTQCTGYELDRLMGDCDPAGCMVDAAGAARMPAARLAGLRARIACPSVGGDWDDHEALLAATAPLAAPRSEPDAPGLIIYSSGTTGDPKGIVLRQRCLVENARRVMQRLRYSREDVLLTLLPSFHLYGYSYDFMYSAMVQAPLVVMDGFTVESATRAIREHGVTVLAGVPTMFARLFDGERLTDPAFDAVRLLVVGGGPVSPSLLDRLRDRGIDAVESYGQTEISTTSAVEVPGDPSPSGSCGRPLPDFEVRVVDASDQDVPVGQPGELLFRSPTFMHGYWRQPELTGRTLRGGWLHTGDIGRIDEEGNLYILDRVKDMIVANGYNIFPKEVENAIALHPSVLSAAVVGVPHELRGEDVHAFVVPREGHRIDPQALTHHCETHLARYKLPRHLSVVDQLPLTANGKIRRFKLREQAQADIAAGRAYRTASAAPVGGTTEVAP